MRCVQIAIVGNTLGQCVVNMKTKVNYCVNCEQEVKFTKGKCEKCKGKYDDVVPASYRNYKYDNGMNKVYVAYKPCDIPKPLVKGLGWYEDKVGYYCKMGELICTDE